MSGTLEIIYWQMRAQLVSGCHSAWVARRVWRLKMELRRKSGPLNHIRGGVKRKGQSAEHSQEEYHELRKAPGRRRTEQDSPRQR